MSKAHYIVTNQIRAKNRLKVNYIFKIYPWAIFCEGQPSLIWGGRGGAKNSALLFQSTVDIHFQNAHKTHKNCEGSHSVRLNYLLIFWCISHNLQCLRSDHSRDEIWPNLVIKRTLGIFLSSHTYLPCRKFFDVYIHTYLPCRKFFDVYIRRETETWIQKHPLHTFGRNPIWSEFYSRLWE